VVAWLSQRISNPIVSGVILLIISTQLATIVLPSYFGWRDWLQAENVESRAPASATTGP
jgi:xanthine/uracil permease